MGNFGKTMKNKVTWHSVKRMGSFQLLAMINGKEVFMLNKTIVDALSNEELLQEVEKNDWYDSVQDPEIIFRGEVVRNPQRHALKTNQF